MKTNKLKIVIELTKEELSHLQTLFISGRSLANLADEAGTTPIVSKRAKSLGEALNGLKKVEEELF